MSSSPFRPSDPIAEHRFGKIINPAKRVSVVIPYYRKRKDLPRALDALKAQAWRTLRPEDVEILVVDDGSDDDVVDLLPEEVIYVCQRRIGFGLCRARNTGAKLSNGEVIVILDPDLLVSQHYLEGVMAAHELHGDRLVQTGYVADYYYAGSPDPRQQFGVWERPDRPTRRFFQLAGGNMAISRKLFLESPGFDEDLIHGELEDILFGWHIGQLPDTAILFNSAMAVRHIPHPVSPFHEEGSRTMELIRRKWPGFYEAYVIRSER